MVGIKVEITYFGKEPKVDKTGERIAEYHKKYTIDHCGDNWRGYCTREFRGILETFEGIKEIRFFI